MAVNKDLLVERRKCTFNLTELTNLLDGGPEKTAERRALVKFFLSDERFKDKVPLEYLSHKEKYEESVKKSVLLLSKINEWTQKKNSMSTVDVYTSVMGGMLGGAVLKDGFPLGLHYVMFIPAILGQGSLEQQATWIPRAWSNEIIGTYAQTELGHGTFIRGLETTAHYDESTEEFILHSPTLTSYKWWPGGLGQTANYAIVMAQLYTKGVCRGIHPFIVQLRDEETHMPLPGIIIGEIGVKLGMNSTNNGYLGFNKVRIPRMQMLMKNNQVLPDGQYVKGTNEKLTYGTMIFVRVSLIKGVMVSYLSKAVTIAVRYSVVRRQSEMKPGQEAQIIEYMTQQYKLFPHIASVMAMIFSSQWLWDMYNAVTSELEEGDLERLPELHAMACCLKAVCSYDAACGIEECRKSCGGHGYMVSSGFPSSYTTTTAAETYEGENTVLYLQTARYLMKCVKIASAGGKVPDTCSYMERGGPRRYGVWTNNLNCLVDAFNQVANGFIISCAERQHRLISSGKSSEDAWNMTSNLLVKAAEAHCRAFIVRTFASSVEALKVSVGVKQVLTQLAELYAVYWLLKNLGHFLMYTELKVNEVSSIIDWQERLLSEIRPNAVSLVDAFDIPDDILCSTLGAWDGNVYERLFEEANRSPLNAEPVNKSFHEYLKPFLKSGL